MKFNPRMYPRAESASPMQRVIFILGECVAPSTERASANGARDEAAPPASLFDAPRGCTSNGGQARTAVILLFPT